MKQNINKETIYNWILKYKYLIHINVYLKCMLKTLANISHKQPMYNSTWEHLDTL